MQTLIVKSNIRNQPPVANTRTETVVLARPQNGHTGTNGHGNGNGQANRALIDAIVNSKVYQEYERAFMDTTGLPVALKPVENWQLPHHGQRGENEFCALLAQKSRSCAACLRVQEKLCEKSAVEAQTVTCPVGMCDTAVCVRMEAYERNTKPLIDFYLQRSQLVTIHAEGEPENIFARTLNALSALDGPQPPGQWPSATWV
ncbi:MAG: hypothetical protein EXS35_02395 [Pedosphaera sp.]|nr:hypothetical protein [Pedosphaera sp.]